MDTRDGRIYTEEEVARMEEFDREYMRPMAHHPTPIQRARKKVGRNEPCPCGSGRKFKRCCEWRSAIGGPVPAAKE
jgi:uncharacterized protein YecA (UPF0149 family)